MTLMIGLTGSIASGKSTIAKMFTHLNIPVIDADQISRKVVEPGEEAYEGVIHQFGKGLLLPTGEINREKLGQIVFADENKRQQLNHIVHPVIRKEMIQQRDHYVKEKHHRVVLDIPLLYENQLTYLVEKTLVVYVDEATQLNRLMERNHYTKNEAWQRINSQMPMMEKATLATAVINNKGTKDESFEQLKVILQKWGISI